MTRTDFDRTTLGWVRKELDETLRQAAQALDEYSQDRSDRTRLRFCASYLHQVYGTLQMLELYGASLLAEEMERLVEALTAGEVGQVDQAEETLMTAILRLSELLERIHGGERDSALALLPLLNDLRTARGAKLLTEGMLFAPDMSAADREERPRDAAAPPLSELARAHRHRYQRALLGVIRGQQMERSLEIMADVLEALDGAAQHGSQADLWWVAAGVVDGLRAGTLTPSGAIKGLLGQVDRQIRRVIGEGDDAFRENPPQDLLKNLLYYVSQAGGATDRIVAIQGRFGLEAPGAGEDGSGTGFGPGSEILASVSAAIREDVTSIKDALDLHVRGAQSDLSRLGAAAGDLARVADTLGMLGLGGPRRVAKEQAAVLQQVADGGEGTEQQYMDLARALLYVEASLDSLLRGDAGEQRDDEEPGLAELDDENLFDLEYRTVYQNAVQEAVADIGAVKETIIRFIDREDHAALQELPSLTDRLQGALNMLDLDRAATLFRSVGDFIDQNVIQPRATPQADVLDALADAITSLEYYLEAVLERRGGRDEILDVAERSLAVLESMPSPRAPESATSDTESSDGAAEADSAAPVHVTNEAPGEAATDEVFEEPTDATVATPQEASAARTSSAEPAAPPLRQPRTGAPGGVNLDVAVASEELDDEILEIFLEEVDEVMETLHQEYPRWKADPNNQDALTTTRRMFHTLKGSGRLAGALLLGEVAWGNERLLNRIIDGQLQVAPAIHSLMDRSIAAFPQLVRQLQDGTSPNVDARALLLEADRLADPQHYADQEAAAASPAELEAEHGADSDPEPETLAPDTATVAEPANEPAADLEFAVTAAPEGPGFGQDTGAAPEVSPDGETEDGRAPDKDQPEFAGEPPQEADGEAQHEPLEFELDDSLFEQDVVSVQPPAARDPVLGEISDSGGQHESDDPDGEAELQFAEFGLDGQGDEDTEFSEWVRSSDPAEAEQDDPPARDAFPEADQQDETGPVPTQSEPGAEADASVPALDPALYQIFRNETADHLAVVRGFLADEGEGGGAKQVTDALTRALHTLAGSARMAGVESVASLGRSLELLADERLETARPLDDEDASLLAEGVTRIEALVEALGDVRQSLPDTADLLARAQERRHQPPVETTAPQADVETSSALADEEPAADAELVDLFLDEAEDILQFLEGTLLRWEDDAGQEGAIAELQRSLHTLKGGARLARFHHVGDLCHVLESLAADVEAHRVPADDAFFGLLQACLERLARMVETARAGAPIEPAGDLVRDIAELRGQVGPAQEPRMPAEETGRDTELVEVFLEESTEILHAIEQAQQSWTEEPDNRRLVQDIQRALHTLKGGARMAGFTPMGDLAHSVETLLTGVDDQHVKVGPALFDLLEQCHDRLHQMREHAAQGVAMVAPSDLFERIRMAEEGRADAPGSDQPSDAAASVPVAEPVTPEASQAVAHLVPAADAEAPLTETDESATEPQAVPARPATAEAAPRQGGDMVRVRADLLDNLVNYAGEVSIYRARLDQQVGAISFNLAELDQTVSRLRAQLRTMEIETEAQILYRYEREHEDETLDEDFDPLELDRFSRMQELSRALSESVNDLGSIQSMLDNLSRESETLLLQQSRVNTELQDGLMRTRMVPFANLASRLRRIVRQTAQDLGKKAQIKLQGAQGEMDRTVLERVTAPLEHMLRNAVAHGIESPEQRRAAGKDETGQITIALDREGADVVLRVSDDGGGMNLDAIRQKALAQGLMREDARLTDREIMQFVLEQGFSTAEKVTQISGRGVGMDVVNAEIKQLGGTLEIDSRQGEGSRFTIRLPFTLAMNQALLCSAGEQAYAIPLSSIDSVVRLTQDQLETYFGQGEHARYHYAGQDYRVTSLATLLGTGEPNLASLGRRIPVVLVQTGDQHIAVQVDELLGNREIVVKSVGPQISTVPGIFGATILADGRVVLILDISALARVGATTEDAPETGAERDDGDRQPLIMVVDDSITMRKVATRLLERNHMQVLTAKDGVDAVARLQEQIPDAMLLDIEMPRMDGYELATHMRNDERLKDVPIIMITSRTGEKHRQRAMEIGVNRYIGKPYQESDLLENLRELLDEHHGRSR